jgi:hypothetical protein
MNLIVIGNAECANDDLIKAKEFFSNYDIMVIGIDALSRVKNENIKYFATYHPADISLIPKIDFQIISHLQYYNKVDIIRPIDLNNEKSGSSALLGVLTAIDLGYDKIILCGCPLEGKDKKQHPYKVFQKAWIIKLHIIAAKVRSISGWTKEYLGEPTKEWLNN